MNEQFRTDDELLEAASKDLGIDKSEFENVTIEDEKNMRYTHVRFTVGDTDYWYHPDNPYCNHQCGKASGKCCKERDTKNHFCRENGSEQNPFWDCCNYK